MGFRAMFTDYPPRSQKLYAAFLESDKSASLEVPDNQRLCSLAKAVENAMESSQQSSVGLACADFLAAAAHFYRVSNPHVRVLAARPIRVREGGWASELFGDYDPEKILIRIWMRTAVRKKVTSFGTFLATLCHEFCHHLDCEKFGFKDSPHTRGFYERVAALYHHARGTPQKRLLWIPMGGSRWRIDWRRMNRSS